MKLVISLGGSIINPGSININLIKELRTIINNSNHQFVIVCGGGSIARDYINAAKELNANNIRLDEIGIKATELNAELISSVLGVKRTKSIDEINNDRVIVTNGLFPGVTTDFDSVVIAGLINADALINLSNVSGVYDKDPKKKGAKLLNKLTYDKLISLASNYELGLGEHFIFDLAAAKLASRIGVKLVFIKGLNNLKLFISGKDFVGSIID